VVSLEHDPYGVLQSLMNSLGFEQNLMTKMLMGMSVRSSRAAIGALWIVAAVLLIPSMLVSLFGWIAGSGAIIEMWAAKP
jgi:hypothetical protein